jgi:hypothetical protein
VSQSVRAVVPGYCDPDVNGHLRDATGARPEARVNGEGPPPTSNAAGAADVAANATHALAQWRSPMLGLALAPTAALATFLLGALQIDQAHAEGDRRNVLLHQRMMEGALAVFEGRIDAPSVKARRARDTAYDAGCARAQRMFYEDREAFLATARIVRASVHTGMLAVADGEDRGADFERRYEENPAFRRGVDHMRRLRAQNPDEFHRWATRLDERRDVIQARLCGHARG